MAAKDFLADRLRTNKIIAPGGGYPELAIYSKDSAGVTKEGGLDNSVLSVATEDVFLFVSGSIGSRSTNTRGTTMFGGDVVVKGFSYFEKQISTAGLTSSELITTTEDIKITDSSKGLYTDNLYKINGTPWDFLTLSNLSSQDLTVNTLSIGNKSLDLNNIYSDGDGFNLYLNYDADSPATNKNSYFKIFGKGSDGLVTTNNPVFYVFEEGSFSLGTANSTFPRVYTSSSEILSLTSPGHVEITIDSDDSSDEDNYFTIKNDSSEVFKVSDTGQITTIAGSTLNINNIVTNSIVMSEGDLVDGVDISEFKTLFDSEIASLAASDITLQTNINNEAATRLAKDNELQGLIDNLQADVDQNELDSDSAISAEAASRLSADNTLQSNIDTEENERKSADADLQSQITALEAVVDQNEIDSDSAENALSNRIDALESDPTTATALTNAIASLQSDIDQNESDADAFILDLQTDLALEITNRTNSDANLTNSIAALQVDVNQNELDADNAIAAETQARSQADIVLQSNIDNLTSSIATLQADVDQNESDADASITQLQTDLSTEISNRQSEDTALTSSIAALQAEVDQNESDADAAISGLQTNLSTEISERKAADTTLQNNINTESIARIAAVNDLSDLSGNIRQSAGLLSTGLFKSGTDPNVDGYKQSSDDVIYFIQPNNVPMTFVQALAKFDEKINENLTSIETLDPAGTVVDLTAIKSRLGLDANDDIATDYISTEFILNADSHNTAIGKLDQQLSNRINSLSIFNITGIPTSSQDNDGKILLYNNDGNTETFTYVDPQTGPQGPAGQDGKGISSTVENNDGTFTLNFTDGTVFTTIDLTGPQGLIGSQGPEGDQGVIGPAGPAGDKGDQGDQGTAGAAATIVVGNITTGDAGTNAAITNTATAAAAVFDFTIPRGDKGDQGDIGPQGQPGDDAPTISGVSIDGSAITTSFNGADDVTVNNGFTVSIADLDNVNINLNTIANGKILKWDDNTNNFIAADDQSGGGGGGVDLTVTDNTTSVAQSATLDVQQLASVTDSGGNEATLVGIIGSAEDADYSDGLFADFTSTTRIGHAIDRFNEVLKALAPSPAPSLDQFDVDTGNGITAKLSFGSSNDQSAGSPSYLSVDNSAGYLAKDYNEVYAPDISTAGSYRLGIYDGSVIIVGTLNDDVDNDTYTNNIVNYPDRAFGSADQGILRLFVNGVEKHSTSLSSFTDNTCDYHDTTTVTMDDTSLLKVNMQVTGTDIPEGTTISSITNATTFIISNNATSDNAVTNKSLTFILGSGDDLNDSNSSGFNLSAAVPGKFASNSDFVNFKYRTGTWKVGIADQVNGRNYVQVKHIIGASETVTGFAEWVNDSNTDQIAISGKSLTLNKSGSKYISGIEYHTDISATYSANIDNFYKYIYSDNTITFDESPVGLASFDDFTIPEIDTDHTKQINLSSTTDLIPTNNRIINGTLQTGFNLSHPLKNNITSVSTNESVNGILLDNQAATSTDLSSNFDDENQRLKDENQIQPQTYFMSGMTNNSYQWDSTESLIGNAGLIVFNSRLYSPKSSDLPNNGDFTNINSNPNYSTIGNENRVWIRKFRNTTGSAVNALLFNISKNNSNVVGPEDPNSLNNNEVNIEFKIPSKSGPPLNPQTNWLSVASDFDFESFFADQSSHTTCGDTLYNGSLDGNTLTNKLAIFQESIADDDYVVVKITAGHNWSGYIDSLEVDFNNVIGNTTDAPELDHINLQQTGVEGNLSFGATNILGTHSSYTSDINSKFDVSGDKYGIFQGKQEVTGLINDTTPANGNNYAQYAFGGGEANDGTLKLEINGDGSKTQEVNLSTTPFVTGDTNVNGSGFVLNNEGPKPARDVNQRPNFSSIYRTSSFKIHPNDQRFGYNFAKITHTKGDGTEHHHTVVWINDNNTDAPDFTDNGSITYSIDNTSITSTEKNHLSGIEYYKKITNIPYEIEVRNLYKNIYSDAGDAVKVFDSTNSRFKIKTLNQTGVNGNLVTTNYTEAGDVFQVSKPLAIIDVTNAASAQNETLKINSIVSADYIKSLPELSSNTPYANMNDITIDTTVKHPLNTEIAGKTTTGASERATSNKLLQYSVSSTVQSVIEEDFSNETKRIPTAAYAAQADASGASWDSTAALTDGLMFYDEKLVYPKVNFRDTTEGGSIIAPSGNPDYSSQTGTKTFYRIFQNNTNSSQQQFTLQLQGDGTVLSESLSATDIKISVKIPNTVENQTTGYLNISKDFETDQYDDGDGALSGSLSSTLSSGNTTSNTITFGVKYLKSNEYFVMKIEADNNWTGYLSNIAIVWS